MKDKEVKKAKLCKPIYKEKIIYVLFAHGLNFAMDVFYNQIKVNQNIKFYQLMF